MGCACTNERKELGEEMKDVKGGRERGGGGGGESGGKEREEKKEDLNIVPRNINSIRFLTRPLDSIYELFSDSYNQGIVSLRLAEYRTTHQRCIIRVIPKTKDTRSSVAIGKMQNEVAVLSKVDHPHVVRTFETLEDQQNYYIVSEAFIPDEFKRFLEQWSVVPRKLAASILEQVLSAITYCHQQGIVHRNIKLENLVFQQSPSDDQFTVKVAGFSDSCFLTYPKLLNTIIGSSAFIAPEVLSSQYTEKCDIWSCGVLLCFLLTGELPFTGKTITEVLGKVRKGEVDFEGERWRWVEKEGVDLARKLLQVDYQNRPSASECLNHPWFALHCPSSAQYSQSIRRSLGNMLAYRAHAALQQGIMMFIINRVVDHREIEALSHSFRALDTNKDGRLSKHELKKGFERLMPPDQAQIEIKRVMDLADLNKNGTIDYSEFLISSFNKEQLLSHSNLSMAFSSFDVDDSRKISVEELKDLFVIKNAENKDELWKELVGMIDTSGDGEIDFPEFVHLMTKVMQ